MTNSSPTKPTSVKDCAKSTQSGFGLWQASLQLADTAWRIAVPVLLLAAPGLAADRAFGSAPWLTIVGTATGFVFAGLLIKRQIDRINKEYADE